MVLIFLNTRDESRYTNDDRFLTGLFIAMNIEIFIKTRLQFNVSQELSNPNPSVFSRIISEVEW